MDRFSREHSCTICHDYGSSECGCPTDSQSRIAKLYAEVVELSEIVRIHARSNMLKDKSLEDAIEAADTAWNDAIEAAEDEASKADSLELALHGEGKIVDRIRALRR